MVVQYHICWILTVVWLTLYCPIFFLSIFCAWIKLSLSALRIATLKTFLHEKLYYWENVQTEGSATTQIWIVRCVHVTSLGIDAVWTWLCSVWSIFVLNKKQNVLGFFPQNVVHLHPLWRLPTKCPTTPIMKTSHKMSNYTYYEDFPQNVQLHLLWRLPTKCPTTPIMKTSHKMSNYTYYEDFTKCSPGTTDWERKWAVICDILNGVLCAGFFFNMIVLLLLWCSHACDYSKIWLVFVLNVATLDSMLLFVLRQP